MRDIVNLSYMSDSDTLTPDEESGTENYLS